MSERKLRLVVTPKCNRACEGCCNNDFDLQSLSAVNGYDKYDTVILTGGEPMLNPQVLMNICADVKQESDAKIILYTAKSKRAMDFIAMLNWVDGVTLTLHEPYDVKPFAELNELLSTKQWDKSFRLNVFKGVDISEIDTSLWRVKDNIEWIKNCPLPDGEELRRFWHE